MASIPPDLEALSADGQAADESSPATELWRAIFPWADLNAQSPPGKWPVLGKDILPVLAVLAGQGPQGAKLLAAGASGELVTDPIAPIQIGELVIPTNVAPNSITVTRPNGGWIIQLTPSASDLILQLTVTGASTGTVYLNVSGTQPAPLIGDFYAVIRNAKDLQLNVSAVVAASGSADIVITARSSVIPIAPLTAFFDTSLASLATIDIVPAQSGKVIYILEFNILQEGVANTAIAVQDDLGNIVARAHQAVAGYQQHPIDGVALVVGHKAVLKNVGGVASASFAGEVIYVQASPNLAPNLGLPSG